MEVATSSAAEVEAEAAAEAEAIGEGAGWSGSITVYGRTGCGAMFQR